MNKKFKRILIATTVLGCAAFVYGFYLVLQRPYLEEKPSQIENLECVAYQGLWYDAETGDSVVSTYWEFEPSQLPSLINIIDKCDSTWTSIDEEGKTTVYWNEDITVQTLHKADTLKKILVYWSEDF